MSLFNSDSSGTKIKNFAGGEGFLVDAKSELAIILLSSFLKEGFYRSKDDTINRIVDLIPQAGYEFSAKAAIYARNKFGMRSVTHIVAGQIAKNVSGKSWTVKARQEIFRRPDDMLEVVAYYKSLNTGKVKFPNSLKKAIAKKLESFSEYQLAKYRGEGKSVKLVDLVNLTHPKHNEALSKLIKGELKSTETWEAKLTETGKVAESEEQKTELKKEAWKDLLVNKKLGYLALIRNCKNIIKSAPECIPLLCEQLENAEAIKKSLVFPFQIAKATEIATDRKVLTSLCRAIDLSLDNIPSFQGRSLIAVDVSGSMAGDSIKYASLFAAAVYKKLDSDILVFNEGSAFFIPPVVDSTITIASQFEKIIKGGTDFNQIFRADLKPYDRIFIFSDMQGWAERNNLQGMFNAYKKRHSKETKLYSFDVAGSGQLKFPQRDVFLLAGHNAEIFKTIDLLEQDKNALVNTIEAINFEGK